LELLIAGIEELGRQKPDKSIQWTHIGYGPSEQHIKTDAKKHLKDNVSYQFLGYLSNDEVISYYSKNPVDVFMNVSSSEGIPVSIMEAQGCGIPVIASAVGGTPEIVSDRVGILLSSNPTPEEIASALSFFIEERENTHLKRIESKTNWRENFNSGRNFLQFTELMKNL
jgi:glycosyltransferase involved in cell wall biosynthesis